MSNLVEITSPEHFKEELSKDLGRVSVLNFWAPWAEPCAAFNQSVKEEAGKFPKVLFLNVSCGEDLLTKRSTLRLFPRSQSRLTLRLFRASSC